MASGLSIAATLLVTGAFHEDGFADVCDGFGGGTTPDRVVEIMRDSRVGAFGAVGIIVILGLKWQSVAELSTEFAAEFVPVMIVAAHALSRGAAGLVMALFPYAQEDGKAKPLANRLTGWRLVISMTCAVTPLLLLPTLFWWSALSALVIACFMGWRFRSRIGGYTGDCLGAVQQVAEVACYLSLIALNTLNTLT